jgi:hypothetical protein
MNGPGKATQQEARRRGDGAPIATKVGRVIPGMTPFALRLRKVLALDAIACDAAPETKERDG